MQVVIALLLAATMPVFPCHERTFMERGGTYDVVDAAAGKYAGPALDGWACVTDGRSFEWVEETKLIRSPLPHVDASAWKGVWKYAGDLPRITIRLRRDGKLNLQGYSEWRAHPDAVPHLGDFDYTSPVSTNFLSLGDMDSIDCSLRLLLVNDRLFVTDNSHCGGMNVRFSALYDRAK
jgi:hypothetical protein